MKELLNLVSTLRSRGVIVSSFRMTQRAANLLGIVPKKGLLCGQIFVPVIIRPDSENLLIFLQLTRNGVSAGVTVYELREEHERDE